MTVRALMLATALGALAPCLLGAVVKLRAPVIYHIDYGDKYFTDETYAETFRAAPPDLVHVGKAVPITHVWGPVPVMRGENQYTGGPGHTLSREAIRLLSPAELEQKIATITAGVKRLHEVGVRWVMPYIAYGTVGGDHETREGFWHFYDNWDTYAKWLGPKPPTDPTTWLMRTADGQVAPGLCGGLTPKYFAPLKRYRMCGQNPYWHKFLQSVVRLAAQCGYDGVFVDNSIVGGDNCEYCRRSLFKFLQTELSADQRRRMLGDKPLADVVQNMADVPAEVLLRWRAACVRDNLASLRRAGAEVKRGFMTFPNSGDSRTVRVVADGCDFYMYESIFTAGPRTGTGVPVSGPVTIRAVADRAEPAPPIEYPLSIRDRDKFVELDITLKLVSAVPVGRETEIAAHVPLVGSSNLDSDALEHLRLVLRPIAGGAAIEVPFEPKTAIGGQAIKGAQRPPLDLIARVRLDAPGEYDVSLAFEFTDGEHLDTTRQLPYREALRWPEPYQTHIPVLLLTWSAPARMVFLDYRLNSKNMPDEVRQLHLAECAAFGNAASTSARGPARDLYCQFLHAHRDLFEGAVPYAPSGILYAYWGGNPVGRGPASGVSFEEILSRRHCLLTGFVDRELSAEYLEPLKTLYLGSANYDLTPGQVKTLIAWVKAGGRLVFRSPDVKINGADHAAVLGVEVDGGAYEKLGRGTLELFKADGADLGDAPIVPGETFPAVRFAAYRQTEPRERLLLHAVNYQVSEHAEGPPVTPAKQIPVRLALPDGWTRVSVKSYSPGRAEPAAIAVQVKAGVAEFTIPQLDIYELVELVRG